MHTCMYAIAATAFSTHNDQHVFSHCVSWIETAQVVMALCICLLQGVLHQDNLATLNLGCGCGHMGAQLSQETADKMSNRPIGAKQLTYVLPAC